MAQPLTLQPFRVLDDNGDPVPGGYVYTYEPGTTTAKATYTDATETTENANPTPLDDNGRPESGGIWGSGAYKIVIKDANGAQVGGTLDNTDSGLDEPYKEFFSGTGAQTVFTCSEDLGVDENALDVWINDSGWYPVPSDEFTISGTTLTFDAAPASGTDNIYVTAPSLNLGSASSAAAAAAASEAAAAASEAAAADSETSAAESAVAAASGTVGDLTALTEVVVAADDIFVLSDTSDSGNNKRDTIQGIVDLAQSVSGLSAATVASGDLVLVNDIDAANAPKKVTAQAIAALAAAWSTGDVKLTLKTTADSGWVMCDDGTIGNAASGGTTRANADTEDLFTLLWTNVSDTYAAVSGGRGASAAADYAANKTIALTKMLGRALAIAGSGASLTTRALGFTTGTETQTLTEANLASHDHSVGISSVGAYQAGANGAMQQTSSLNTGNAGSGTAHNNMQPSTFLNAMVKL